MQIKYCGHNGGRRRGWDRLRATHRVLSLLMAATLLPL
ncbi:hypothetical protein BH09ACT13_BH09ACT13_05810 [soil metagenome]